MARRSCMFVAPVILLLSASCVGVQTTPSGHGIDVAGMDRSIKPGDDFFRFANGTWDKNTPIPPDRATWGIDAMLDEQATEHTRALLEDAAANRAAGSDERKAGDYFKAMMDEAAIEKRGLSPLK